jgi:Domain of unknown function (DUF4386)
MNTGAMTERIAEASPRTLARMAGVSQLLEAITAAFGQVIVLGRLVVVDNAAATAANILGHEQLFWLGFASSVVAVIFHIAYALLFYDLFKPVNRRVSLFAMLVLLVASAVQALTAVLYLGPMLILKAGRSLSAFTAEQLQALAYAFVRLNAYAFNTHLALFGLWCLLTGFLIFRCIFMPRGLGVLLMISGLGWLMYLVPPLAVLLFMPYIAVASAIGEIPVEMWLILMAVNAERWKQQASAAGASIGT